MSDVTIEQMNEAIALFMGATIDNDGNVKFILPADGKGLAGCGKRALKYHSSWDWLMPVVAKIPELIHATNELKLRREMSERWKPIENELCNVDLKNVHFCVYQFILWYQKQQSNKNNA